MSHILVNRVKQMTGLAFGDKSILYRLADESHDGKTVFLRLDRLALYAGCSVRTAQRALRHLENLGILIPQGEKQGRGTVHVYRFNLEGSSSEPTEEESSNDGLTIEFLRRWESWTEEEKRFWGNNAPE